MKVRDLVELLDRVKRAQDDVAAAERSIRFKKQSDSIRAAREAAADEQAVLDALLDEDIVFE